MPDTDNDDPIPTKPDRKVVPVFCRLYVGAEVPIPNLPLLLSKYRLGEAVILDEELKNDTPPLNPDPDIPPEPTVQVMTLLDESRQRALPEPDDNPVKETVDAACKVLVLVSPEAVKLAADNDAEKLPPAPERAEETVND